MTVYLSRFSVGKLGYHAEHYHVRYPSCAHIFACCLPSRILPPSRLRLPPRLRLSPQLSIAVSSIAKAAPAITIAHADEIAPIEAADCCGSAHRSGFDRRQRDRRILPKTVGARHV